MNNALKTALVKAAKELQADGWTHQFTVKSDCKNKLKYGMFFCKDDLKFYLNKDTCMPSFTGPEMAQACKPLFN